MYLGRATVAEIQESQWLRIQDSQGKMLHQRQYRNFVLNLVVLMVIAVPLLTGCGGGSGGSNETLPEIKTALVVGNASGPVYQELGSSYVIETGDGTESATGFDVLIYGQSVTADQIQTLPATGNFLFTGKILIVLAPGEADRRALETRLGATALIEDQAVAVFDAFSSDGSLQTVSMVEFPQTFDENPNPPDTPLTDPDGLTTTNPAVTPDDATLRAQTEQWRTLYEAKHAEAAQAMARLTGVSPAEFAAAAADRSPTPDAGPTSGGNMDLEGFTNPAQQFTPAANGSRFLTVQPFFEFTTQTLRSQSIYYLDRFQKVYPHAVYSDTAFLNGACPYRPSAVSFDLVPSLPAVSNVNVETATYRMLEQYNNGLYAHEIIARQYILSSPSVTRPPQPIGKEKVTMCLATKPGSGPWVCAGHSNIFCGLNYDDYFDLSSLRAYNEQVKSTLSWDETTAGALTLDSLLPMAANNVMNVTTSHSYSRTVNWSIQGGLDGGLGRNVGLNLGANGGESHTWMWDKSQSMNMPDWQMVSNGLAPGPTSTYDFFASNGPNNLANLTAYATSTGVTAPSLTALTDLQAQALTERNESDWSTKFKGKLLPPAKATLNVAMSVAYGETFNLFTLGNCVHYPFCAGRLWGLYPYGALHSFFFQVPIEFDFSKALLQPPLPALWTITATLTPVRNPNGFFPVNGTVTLNEPSPTDTTLYLGAEVYPFGNSQPADTVIKNLATQVVVPAGELSASFSALAQFIGFPYNVRWWAFQSQGRQIAYPMTVPGQ